MGIQYHHLSSAIVLAIAATISLPTYASNLKQVATTAQKQRVTDRIIIQLKEDDKARSSALSKLNRLDIATAGIPMRIVKMSSERQAVVKLDTAYHIAEVEQYAAVIATNNDIEYAEPDYFVYPAAVDQPDDPYYYRQWSLFEAGVGMNLPDAWEITTGSPDIVTAVIDSGITDHEEFAGRLVDGYDFITADSVSGSTEYLTANDGNGRDSDPSDSGDWISSTENNGSESDGFFSGCGRSNSSWHGTHVAGIIGASANNGIGVTGINWNSPIMALRVLGKCGGYVSDIADAIRYASGQDLNDAPKPDRIVDIMNLSLSRQGKCSRTEQNAINYAAEAGVAVVVAAGNSGANADNYAPGNCANVISVGATGKHGNIASYSNYGDAVDISAPGGDFSGIISTLNSGNTVPGDASYASYVGTSMAAAQVSGVISLMLSVNNELSPDTIEEILIATAQPVATGGCGYGDGAGAGIIDAYAAVQAAQAGEAPTHMACDGNSTFELDGDIDENEQSLNGPDTDPNGQQSDDDAENTGSSGSMSWFILLLLAAAMIARATKHSPLKLKRIRVKHRKDAHQPSRYRR